MKKTLLLAGLLFFGTTLKSSAEMGFEGVATAESSPGTRQAGPDSENNFSEKSYPVLGINLGMMEGFGPFIGYYWRDLGFRLSAGTILFTGAFHLSVFKEVSHNPKFTSHLCLIANQGYAAYFDVSWNYQSLGLAYDMTFSRDFFVQFGGGVAFHSVADGGDFRPLLFIPEIQIGKFWKL